jgi:hypothetical protein
MSDDADGGDAAEERLAALLALLRTEEVRADPRLTRAVLQRARFELRVRRAVVALSDVAQSVAGGLALLLGSRSGGPTR